MIVQLARDHFVARFANRGEFFVPLRNESAVPQAIEPGERIAQMILTPFLTAQFVEAETLSDTVRGEGGFGSTGTK